MFKNPLKKYQQGGAAPTQEEQQVLAAFIEWLPKRVKEFEGMQPEAIAQALDGMTKTPEGQKQVQQLMEQFQQEIQSAQAFRQGGKIHDFICKHAKGGHVAGCGCKENGGTVEKGQNGEILGLRPRVTESSEFKVPGIVEIVADAKLRKTPDVGIAKGRRFGNVNWKGSQYFLENAQIGGNTIDTWVKVTPQKDTLIRQELPSGRVNNLYDDQVESIMQRFRPDIQRLTQQYQDGGLMRAKNYYNNHANEGIIRKIQNFLSARGYDLGSAGIDGVFGQKTYDAIRQYQRDNGLVDDGMWGEDTNEVHRVLGAGDTTFNGSRSGAHPGTHTYTKDFVNQPYAKSGKVTYTQINDAIARAISEPEWFWGDSDDAKAWRLLFEKETPDGQRGAILKQIYDGTPDDIRESIALNKLPNDLKSAVYNQGIRNATTEAAPVVAGALSLPFMIGDPLVAAGGMLGAHVLGNVGERWGTDMGRFAIDPETGRVRRDPTTGSAFFINTAKNPLTSLTGAQIPLVRPDYSTEGRAWGTAIGGVLGAAVGQGAKSLPQYINPDFRYNPTGIKFEVKPGEKIIKPESTIKIELPASEGEIQVPERTLEIPEKLTKRTYTWHRDWRPTPPKPNPDGTFKNSTIGGKFSVQRPGDLYVTEKGLNGFLKKGGKLK